MSDKFTENLLKIDTSEANLDELQGSLLNTLRKKGETNTWRVKKINPLVEGVKISELLEDPLTIAVENINNLANDLDALYSELSNINNFNTSDMDSMEGAIASANVALEEVKTFRPEIPTDYTWITDTFNDGQFIDSSSNCFVDTDNGLISLQPLGLEQITGLDIQIDTGGLIGIPGCNMLALDVKGSSDGKTLTPTLEKNNTDLNNLVDNNNQTWFEIERNFIPKKLPLKRLGRAWVVDSSSPLQDVNAATGGFDWDIDVSLHSSDVIKTKYAEYLESNLLQENVDYEAKLKLTINLTNPDQFSNIKIIPFLRANYPNVILESLDVVAEGQTIPLAREVVLGVEKKSTKLLETVLSKSVGAITTGSLFQIPTNKIISQVILTISGKPAVVNTRLAHIFKEEEIQQRTQRNYLFFSSVNKFNTWNRKASTDTTRTLKVSKKELDLLGSTSPFFQQSKNLLTGNVLQNLIGGSGPGALLGNLNLTQLLGKTGAANFSSLLGKAVPVLSAIQIANDLLKSAFAVSTTKTSLGETTGHDLFSGFRSYAALRDISLNKIVYANSGTCVTKKRTFSQPVKAINLIMNSVIPDNWGSGQWVTVLISEDGVTWTTITESAKYIPSKPVESVYLKLILEGNASDVTHTPVVTFYTLQGEPLI